MITLALHDNMILTRFTNVTCRQQLIQLINNLINKYNINILVFTLPLQEVHRTNLSLGSRVCLSVSPVFHLRNYLTGFNDILHCRSALER
jgi:hypothetical protein